MSSDSVPLTLGILLLNVGLGFMSVYHLSERGETFWSLIFSVKQKHGSKSPTEGYTVLLAHRLIRIFKLMQSMILDGL
jgi:hypothetical protein